MYSLSYRSCKGYKVDFERNSLETVALYIFSAIWLQKLHYCLVPIYISSSIFCKYFDLYVINKAIATELDCSGVCHYRVKLR